jgi:hypothetical protein
MCNASMLLRCLPYEHMYITQRKVKNKKNQMMLRPVRFREAVSVWWNERTSRCAGDEMMRRSCDMVCACAASTRDRNNSRNLSLTHVGKNKATCCVLFYVVMRFLRWSARFTSFMALCIWRDISRKEVVLELEPGPPRPDVVHADTPKKHQTSFRASCKRQNAERTWQASSESRRSVPARVMTSWMRTWGYFSAALCGFRGWLHHSQAHQAFNLQYTSLISQETQALLTCEWSWHHDTWGARHFSFSSMLAASLPTPLSTKKILSSWPVLKHIFSMHCAWSCDSYLPVS